MKKLLFLNNIFLLVLTLVSLIISNTESNAEEYNLIINTDLLMKQMEHAIRDWDTYQTKALTKLREKPIKVSTDKAAIGFLRTTIYNSVSKALVESKVKAPISIAFKIPYTFFSLKKGKTVEPTIAISPEQALQTEQYLTQAKEPVLATKFGQSRITTLAYKNDFLINDVLDAALFQKMIGNPKLENIIIDVEIVMNVWKALIICEPPRKPWWCYFFTDP